MKEFSVWFLTAVLAGATHAATLTPSDIVVIGQARLVKSSDADGSLAPSVDEWTSSNVPAGPSVVEPPIDPPTTGSLLTDQAATMQPGEWRNIAGLTTWPGKESKRTFKSFQYVKVIDKDGDGKPDGKGGADGMGWTQTMAYHEGRLILFLMRGHFQRALMVMEPDGKWWRVNQPAGFDKGGRRPFNRLTQDDTYAYFAPNDAKTAMGYFYRTPLAAPGPIERYGVAIGDSQMDSVGNFAVTYVPDWGRFYAYTPGGKLWTWTHGEDKWTRLPGDKASSGYGGVLVWNSVKKELIAAGGQNFGGNPSVGHIAARITEPFGPVVRVGHMLKSDGSQMRYTAAQGKLIVDPRDGGYIQNHGSTLYKASEIDSAYEFYHELNEAPNAKEWPFGRYELYAPFAFIPGTDVMVFVSHIRGVVLHRLK